MSVDAGRLERMSEPAARTHHSIDYLEFGVTDLAVAKQFYGDAFGWTFNDYGPGPNYVGIRRPGGAETDEVGGFRLDPQVTPGGALVLLYSDDLEASIAQVRAAGGEVVSGPYEFPGGRRFHFTDPAGNELGVWSSS